MITIKRKLTGPLRLNPAKLLHSKWTATTPRNKEKHFIVTRLFQPEVPNLEIEFIEIEALYTRRRLVLRWRALLEGSHWLQGWR